MENKPVKPLIKSSSAKPRKSAAVARTQLDPERWVDEAIDVLAGVEGIAFIHFDERDVVRHPLVQRIVAAYDRYSRQGGAQP